VQPSSNQFPDARRGAWMIATVRELLRRKLSPRFYEYVRSFWCDGRYALRSVRASFLAQRNPKVQGFPNNRASALVQQLRSINLLAPTKMCRVMTKYGSDKGQTWHNYTAVYSALFGRLSNQPLRIFEIGLGTNNPEVTSSMGINGRPGASLRGWRELFPNALVYGADIDREILFEEDRIKTFYCDQLDGVAIRDLWSQPPLKDGMDIIIDDGLHTFEGNISFLNGSWEQLRQGGFYVIEDILQETIERWHNHLETIYSKRSPSDEFAFAELPNPFNHHDNNLLIIRKGGLGIAPLPLTEA
jgi:hypothetical protein